MLVEEKNRRHQASALLRPGVEAHIAWLEGQRAEVDRLLESVVASDPAWRDRVEVLDSAPGIGFLTATLLAVGVPALGASRQAGGGPGRGSAVGGRERPVPGAAAYRRGAQRGPARAVRGPDLHGPLRPDLRGA